MLLAMLFKEIISLQPELSSPPHFRSQGRHPKRDGVRTEKNPLCLMLYLFHVGLANTMAKKIIYI